MAHLKHYWLLKGGGCYSRMNGIFSVGVLALIRASFQLPRQAIKIHQKRNWKNLY